MAKFYHYTVWPQTESGKKINLDTCLTADSFSSDRYKIKNEENEDKI